MFPVGAHHDDGIDDGGLPGHGVDGPFRRLRAEVAHPQELVGVGLDQERRNRMFGQICFVLQALFDDGVGHGEGQRTVGSRFDGDPEIGFGG